MSARIATIVAAFVCAGCATAGDTSLLTAPIPAGSTITPAEKPFPPVQRFPVKVTAGSWAVVSSVAGMGLGGEAPGDRQRVVEDTLGRVRGYFESDGAFPVGQLVVTPGRPRITSGAEAQLVGGTSVSKSVQTWSYTFTVEDWENQARPALSVSGSVEVVGTLKISFDELRQRVQEWSLATLRRGVQNVLVDLVETLDRRRPQLAELNTRYAAWRGRTPPAAAAASRRERIRRVEDLLIEAERLNPGGAELADLRRRLDRVKPAAD